MASNFDFLKDIDKELYSSIIDAEKLFRDEYFTQCCVQLRVYAEKTAKKVLGKQALDLTFDDVINCLKDKIKNEQEKEFIDDLFFIKREGNKCAHGEDATSSATLEAIRRAFEIAINYSFAKKKDEKFLKLQFDETLLITQKPLKSNSLVEKYVELANEQREELLNSKQGEFNSAVPKTNDGIKDESYIDISKVENKKAKRKKKELTPAQIRVKEKIKAAREKIKEEKNKFKQAVKEKQSKPKEKRTQKKQNKTESKKQKRKNKKTVKLILFSLFVLISLYFLTKMLFFGELGNFLLKKYFILLSASF